LISLNSQESVKTLFQSAFAALKEGGTMQLQIEVQGVDIESIAKMVGF